MHKENVGFY